VASAALYLARHSCMVSGAALANVPHKHSAVTKTRRRIITEHPRFSRPEPSIREPGPPYNPLSLFFNRFDAPLRVLRGARAAILDSRDGPDEGMDTAGTRRAGQIREAVGQAAKINRRRPGVGTSAIHRVAAVAAAIRRWDGSAPAASSSSRRRVRNSRGFNRRGAG
jgi:hypothetical protein